MNSAQQAERDKSRPYACRHMPTRHRLVEDTKLKGLVLVTLTISGKKVSSYWLYVPLLPINKALQNFQSGFTGHQ